MAHAHDLRRDWRGRPVCGHRVPVCLPSLASLAHVVRLLRKRYHPLYTLQAQGRMHVQMKIHPHVRPMRELDGEERLTDFLGQMLGGLA